MQKLLYKLVLWLSNKLSTKYLTTLATTLLAKVLNSKDSSITDVEALAIIETVVKSSGNKVVDFIIEDE